MEYSGCDDAYKCAGSSDWECPKNLHLLYA